MKITLRSAVEINARLGEPDNHQRTGCVDAITLSAALCALKQAYDGHKVLYLEVVCDGSVFSATSFSELYRVLVEQENAPFATCSAAFLSFKDAIHNPLQGVRIGVSHPHQAPRRQPYRGVFAST